MKKIIIVAALVLISFAANAQSITDKIDTTDATTKYLLRRIEQLEHQLCYQQDCNELYHLYNDLLMQREGVYNNHIDKKTLKELFASTENKYKALSYLVSERAVLYRYTDDELNVIGASANLIEMLFTEIRDSLKKR